MARSRSRIASAHRPASACSSAASRWSSAVDGASSSSGSLRERGFRRPHISHTTSATATSTTATTMAMDVHPPPLPCDSGAGALSNRWRSHSAKSSQARSSQDGLSRW